MNCTVMVVGYYKASHLGSKFKYHKIVIFIFIASYDVVKLLKTLKTKCILAVIWYIDITSIMKKFATESSDIKQEGITT